MAHLETELEQSRLRETETLGALREMQDKVLDMEKVQLGGCCGRMLEDWKDRGCLVSSGGAEVGLALPAHPSGSLQRKHPHSSFLSPGCFPAGQLLLQQCSLHPATGPRKAQPPWCLWMTQDTSSLGRLLHLPDTPECCAHISALS